MWTIDSAILVHEVLMKFLISRDADEPFYSAVFVHDADEAMSEVGWIEWCGDGWRITDKGVRFFEIIDKHLIQIAEGRLNMVGICKKEGCRKPRHVSISGNEFTYCHEHQKEQWAANKREQDARKKEKEQADKAPHSRVSKPAVKSLGRAADLIVPPSEVHVIEAAPLPMDEPVEDITSGDSFLNWRKFVPSPEKMDSEPSVEVAVTPIQSDCDSCYAKAVVDALKAKSPKLAALIDAMEQEQRAAHDLGL